MMQLLRNNSCISLACVDINLCYTQYFDETREPPWLSLALCDMAVFMVDLYTALDVHTTETIEEGHRWLKEFSDLLQVP